MICFHDLRRFESVLVTSWAILEASRRRVLVFWRCLEESLARLLHPRVDSQTILKCLGGGLEVYFCVWEAF